jgi:hypothetical protein
MRERTYMARYGVHCLVGLLWAFTGAPVEAQEEPRTPDGEPGGQASQGDRIIEDSERARDEVTEPGERPWASGVPLEKRKGAYQRFLEGNENIKEGSFGGAADKYREAIALWDHPAFHYNLGIAQKNLGKPIDAYHCFLEARRYGAQPITQEKFDRAQKYLDELREQLGEIEVICNEPGAEVALDGVPLFSAPGRESAMVSPGRHRIEASKRGFLPGVQHVVLNAGESKRVTVTPVIPEHLVTVRRWPQWIPWSVAGLGIAALAGAGAMDSHSSTLFDVYDQEIAELCPGSGGCAEDTIPATLRARLDHGHAWQWTARATYALGGLALATSATLLYLNRERIVRERAPAADGLGLRPMLMLHGAGVSAQMDF